MFAKETYIPPLPDDALPTGPQAEAASGVASWLDHWMDFATANAITAPSFLRAGALWLIGTATARRAVLRLTHQPPIFNTHYIWWVAPTTYYRKSTGLHVIKRATEPFAHLLLPDAATPEVLKSLMAAQDSKNQQDLSAEFQKREHAAKRFAAQRGLIVDEATGLFEKDYQTGIRNLILQWDNNPDEMVTETLSRGKLVMRRIGVNLLFADTPAAIASEFGSNSWRDGLFARFAFITPQGASVTLPRPNVIRERTHATIPNQVIEPLARLADKLLPGPESPPQPMDCETPALDLYWRYAEATHKLTHPESFLDDRLFGTYGRLPKHALRVAMSLTLIDYAAGHIKTPTITIAHMARALLLVEDWRRSAHEMLAHINRGPDAHYQDAVLRFMNRHPNKAQSMRDIYRGAHIHSMKAAKNAVDALLTEGTVVQIVTHESKEEKYILAENLNLGTSKYTSGEYADFIQS